MKATSIRDTRKKKTRYFYKLMDLWKEKACPCLVESTGLKSNDIVEQPESL